MPKAKSPLPITVPMSLHDALSAAVSEAFAVSYLCGASLEGSTLRPRTQIARERLDSNPVAMKALKGAGIRLGESLRPNEREPLPGETAPWGDIPKAWKEPTQEEYEAQSISEKIRTNKILACEARLRAGPMMKNRRPAGPDELPDKWHQWTRVAKHHEAEAKRFREIINFEERR